MSDWIEIIIPATAASADDVAALIAREVPAAQSGTEIRSGNVVFWAPLETCEHVLLETREAVKRLAAAGIAVDSTGVSARAAVPEAEWRDAWKRHFHVIRLTRQLVIVPSWESYEPAGDDLVIHLDPGQAFGTGAHASTRLCLSRLQALADRGIAVHRFLDLGAGSGILAVFATKLWPECTGMAVDIDPLAVSASRENAAANGVAGRIECSATPAVEITETFDLVLANIQADVLLALKDAIIARVAPGGHLILSGLLSSQVEAVAASYGAALVLEGTHRSEHDPEWSSATLRRDG